MDGASVLRTCQFFEAFEPPDLERVLAETSVRTLERGASLFAEDAPSDRMYVVGSGRLAIAKRSVDGKQSIVALRQPGDLIGEMGLFDGMPRSSEARALQTSELAVIPYAPVAAILTEHPERLRPIVTLFCQRVRATDTALADSRFLDVAGRTAKRLLELSDNHDEFVLPITQEELAGMVGASRERVNKALAQFVRLGWLTIHERRYRINHRSDLERRAS